MTPNIAIFGHSGKLGIAMTNALARAHASIRVLYRKSSNLSTIPNGVECFEVGYDDQTSLVKALSGVDIIVVVLGRDAIHIQSKIIPAAKIVGVKLFVPSEFGATWSEEETLGVPALETKTAIKKELQAQGVPCLHINCGSIADIFFKRKSMGIDVENNKLNALGGNFENRFALSSMEYISHVTATILTESTPSSLAGKTLGFYELNPNLAEIASAMESKHGFRPEVTYTSQTQLEKEFLAATDPLEKFLAAIKCKWGKDSIGVGPSLWEGTIVGYNKKALTDFM